MGEHVTNFYMMVEGMGWRKYVPGWVLAGLDEGRYMLGYPKATDFHSADDLHDKHYLGVYETVKQPETEFALVPASPGHLMKGGII